MYRAAGAAPSRRSTRVCTTGGGVIHVQKQLACCSSSTAKLCLTWSPLNLGVKSSESAQPLFLGGTPICIHEQLFPGLSHSVQVTRFRTVAALRRVPPPNHRSSLSARTRTLARLSRLSSNQLAFHPIANGSGGGRRRRTGGSVDRRPAAREGVRVRGPSERRPRPRDQWYRGGAGGEDGALKSREPLLSLSVRGGGTRPSARPQARGGGRPAAGRGRGGVDWGRP